MPRTEIEYFPAAAMVAASAAENLAALEPTHKYQRVRRGNIETLAIHLGRVQFDILADSLHDRMPVLDHPQPFLLIPPRAISGRMWFP